MKNLNRNRLFTVLASVAMAAFLYPASLMAQVQTTITTNSAAQTKTSTQMQLTSATNAVVGSEIFIDQELELITAISGTVATVQRGAAGTTPASHAVTTSLLVGTPDKFQSVDPPFGACTSATDYPGNAKPWVNVTDGNIWLCRSSLWQGTNTQNLSYNSLTQQ